MDSGTLSKAENKPNSHHKLDQATKSTGTRNRSEAGKRRGVGTQQNRPRWPRVGCPQIQVSLLEPHPAPSSGPEKASSWETPKETSCSHHLSLEILLLLFNRFTSTWSSIPASNSLSAWDRVAQKALRAQGLEELGVAEGNGLARASSRPAWQSHVLAASSDRGVLACCYQ